MTIALEHDDDEEANRYFNTSLFGSVGMGLLLIPIVALATIYIGSIIDIPAGLEMQTRWLFMFTVGGFLLGLLQAPSRCRVFVATDLICRIQSACSSK